MEIVYIVVGVYVVVLVIFCILATAAKKQDQQLLESFQAATAAQRWEGLTRCHTN